MVTIMAVSVWLIALITPMQTPLIAPANPAAPLLSSSTTTDASSTVLRATSLIPPSTASLPWLAMVADSVIIVQRSAYRPVRLGPLPIVLRDTALPSVRLVLTDRTTSVNPTAPSPTPQHLTSRSSASRSVLMAPIPSEGYV